MERRCQGIPEVCEHENGYGLNIVYTNINMNIYEYGYEYRIIVCRLLAEYK